MPLQTIYPDDVVVVQAFNPTAMGSAAAIGQTTILVSPVRGNVREVGFSPNSLVASTSTITVQISDPDAVGSSFTQIVSSTLGSFSSAVLFEAAVASVVVPNRAPIKPGGVLRCVTSGNLTAVGATVYAVIDRG